jgi:amino acid transporter
MASSPPSTDAHAPFQLIKALGLWDVVLMTVVAVVSPRWLTRSAQAGPPALAVWALAGLTFGLPLALTAIALARRFPEQGGLYPWTRRAFGPFHGFVCGWCYWLSNLFFFPSILLFAAANALAVGGDRTAGLADSRAFTAVFVLVVLWACTALNIAGLRAGRWLPRLGMIGIWAPAVLIVAAAGVALTTTGSATSFAPAALVPQGAATGSLGLWSTLCFAFVGFEITTFMTQEVQEGDRTIARGVPIAVALVAIYYIVGTASVLVVLPADAFSERTGLAEAIDLIGARLALPSVGGLVGLLLAIAFVAITHSWMAGAARIPFAIGLDAAMPAALARLHPRYRTPHIAIAVQALVASLVFLASLFLTLAGTTTTVMEAYDILVGLTIIANLVPYLYLFAALLMLAGRDARAGAPHAVRLPGGRAGLWLVVMSGLAATIIAIALTFLPPVGTSNVANYELNLAWQTVAVLLVGLGVYWWSKRRAARA